MLSIVSTPIGNLGDITLRAIETLKACEGIICEDTRVTGQLLKHLDIPKKELISMHGYSDDGKAQWIVDRLKAGEHLAIVSDAGTPGISDPGYAVVSLAAKAEVQIEVIPGASAVLTALSGSGLPIHQFIYLGFLPLKKGRKTLFEQIAAEDRTVVFYESVHRIEKTLNEVGAALHATPSRPVVIGRELTKMHEEFVRTTIADVATVAGTIVKKGEFVIVIGPVPRGRTDLTEEPTAD